MYPRISGGESRGRQEESHEDKRVTRTRESLGDRGRVTRTRGESLVGQGEVTRRVTRRVRGELKEGRRKEER